MSGAEVDVMAVLDAMLARARTEHPGIEWVITVSAEQAARIPLDGDKLWRAVNGNPGYYAGPVYSDCMVEVFPVKPWLVSVHPYHADAAHYYADLRTGTITTSPPADAFFSQEEASS